MQIGQYNIDTTRMQRELLRYESLQVTQDELLTSQTESLAKLTSLQKEEQEKKEQKLLLLQSSTPEINTNNQINEQEMLNNTFSSVTSSSVQKEEGEKKRKLKITKLETKLNASENVVHEQTNEIAVLKDQVVYLEGDLKASQRNLERRDIEMNVVNTQLLALQKDVDEQLHRSFESETKLVKCQNELLESNLQHELYKSKLKKLEKLQKLQKLTQLQSNSTKDKKEQEKETKETKETKENSASSSLSISSLVDDSIHSTMNTFLSESNHVHSETSMLQLEVSALRSNQRKWTDEMHAMEQEIVRLIARHSHLEIEKNEALATVSALQNILTNSR